MKKHCSYCETAGHNITTCQERYDDELRKMFPVSIDRAPREINATWHSGVRVGFAADLAEVFDRAVAYAGCLEADAATAEHLWLKKLRDETFDVIGVLAMNAHKFAKAGDSLTAKATAHLRKTYRHLEHAFDTKESVLVRPKDPTITGGQWGCADCGHMFQNNSEAFSHPKSHRLAWWCADHFEEP